MKMMKKICLVACAAIFGLALTGVRAQLNVLSNPGFEDYPEFMVPYIIQDFGESYGWESYNANFEVRTNVVLTGTNAVYCGLKDLAATNYVGDRYSNLRQYLFPADVDPSITELPSTKWDVSVNVYYDSSATNNGASTDGFTFLVGAVNWFNIDNYFVGGYIAASNLNDGAWTELTLSLDVPAQPSLDPNDPDYDNKVYNRIGFLIIQDGNAGHTGKFYFDDAALELVPNAFYPITVTPEDGSDTATNPVIVTATIVNWTNDFVSATMQFDGSPVTPTSTNTIGNTNIVTYNAGVLPEGSAHTAQIDVLGDTGGTASKSWAFSVSEPLKYISNTPADGAVNVSTGSTVVVVIEERLSELDTNSVSLYLNDVEVTGLTFTNDLPLANQWTITGMPDLDPATVYTGKVVYSAINPAAGPYTVEGWEFTTAGDPGFGIYIWPASLPTIDADDISQTNNSADDATNVGFGDDDHTYSALDRPAQGQTFFTDSGSANYELSSVWVKHADYLQTWVWGPDIEVAAMTLRITDPVEAGTTNFVLHEFVLNVVTNYNYPSQMTSDPGEGFWVEFRPKDPIVLDGSREYGFDIAAEPYGAVYNENDYWELSGTIETNAYTSGTAYSSFDEADRGIGSTNLITRTGDRTFVLSLEAVAPTVGPTISISVSGGSAILTWDAGAYDVLTNSSLVNPGGWGVAVPGALPPVTNAIGSEDQLFYKLEY